MGYRWIDMENYPRIQHFAYFRGLAYPYVGLTAEVDITLLMQRMERERIPFFLTVCYCAARAANAVPQLRQRIRGDKIIEFDRCMTSHTVALEDGTYCYCTLDSGMAFGDFLSYAARVQERAATARSLGESEEDAEACFFCIYAAVADLHRVGAAGAAACGQQSAHHMGQIFHTGAEDPAAGFSVVPSCIGGRNTYRRVLQGAGQTDPNGSGKRKGWETVRL